MTTVIDGSPHVTVIETVTGSTTMNTVVKLLKSVSSMSRTEYLSEQETEIGLDILKDNADIRQQLLFVALGITPSELAQSEVSSSHATASKLVIISHALDDIFDDAAMDPAMYTHFQELCLSELNPGLHDSVSSVYDKVLHVVKTNNAGKADILGALSTLQTIEHGLPEENKNTFKLSYIKLLLGGLIQGVHKQALSGNLQEDPVVLQSKLVQQYVDIMNVIADPTLSTKLYAATPPSRLVLSTSSALQEMFDVVTAGVEARGKKLELWNALLGPMIHLNNSTEEQATGEIIFYDDCDETDSCMEQYEGYLQWAWENLKPLLNKNEVDSVLRSAVFILAVRLMNKEDSEHSFVHFPENLQQLKKTYASIARELLTLGVLDRETQILYSSVLNKLV